VRKSVHTDGYKKLIAALKNARLNADMTQVKLAKRLRAPQSFVAKYERGERRLDIVELVAICKAIGIRPHQAIDLLLD
jgi:transcriptional regulator with XRE-family HTH domain